jgi:Family of unknown function (DUF6069)
MSSVAVSPTAAASSSASDTPRAVNWSRLAPVGSFTTIAAAAANVAVYYAGDSLIGYNPAFVELGSAFGIVVCTVIPALIAVLLYAALMHSASNPARTFTIVSAVVFIITLVPDLTFIPEEPGSSNAQTTVPTVMHAVAAALIVPMLTSLIRPRVD